MIAVEIDAIRFFFMIDTGAILCHEINREDAVNVSCHSSLKIKSVHITNCDTSVYQANQEARYCKL